LNCGGINKAHEIMFGLKVLLKERSAEPCISGKECNTFKAAKSASLRKLIFKSGEKFLVVKGGLK
jgi:hypothetical protein